MRPAHSQRHSRSSRSSLSDSMAFGSDTTRKTHWFSSGSSLTHRQRERVRRRRGGVGVGRLSVRGVAGWSMPPGGGRPAREQCGTSTDRIGGGKGSRRETASSFISSPRSCMTQNRRGMDSPSAWSCEVPQDHAEGEGVGRYLARHSCEVDIRVLAVVDGDDAGGCGRADLRYVAAANGDT